MLKPTPLKLALVTTARSDYSTMYPVMRAAMEHDEIDARIFCGGMHLVPAFGNTYTQLEEDGLTIAEKVDFFSEDDSPLSLASALSKGTQAFAEALLRQEIEMILVSGDRVENMALYSAATALRLPIAHMCGGDITEGAFDNQIRHMMTKLSHLHFVSMPEHAGRVIQMGEEPWRVTITGDAALDEIVKLKHKTRKELKAELEIAEDRPFVISTFHPQTLGDDDFIQQYANMLEALKEVDAIPVLTYPNIDPGFEGLIELLDNFVKKRPDTIVKKSCTREQYYALLSHALFMIGNSSSGIWEAPSFALPVVNIGGRQAGRLRAKNVIDINGNNIDDIKNAITKASNPVFKQSLEGIKNPYGDGHAAKKTLDVLANIKHDNRLMVKKFYELDVDVASLNIEGSAC